MHTRPRQAYTRQTGEYGTQVVMTWRMWANISHVGGMWVLDGLLLPIWEEYGSAVGGSIRTRPYLTHMGQKCSSIFGILVKGSHGSHMGALWVHSPHGANTCPTWAKVREYAHLGHMWVKRGLKC